MRQGERPGWARTKDDPPDAPPTHSLAESTGRHVSLFYPK